MLNDTNTSIALFAQHRGVTWVASTYQRQRGPGRPTSQNLAKCVPTSRAETAAPPQARMHHILSDRTHFQIGKCAAEEPKQDVAPCLRLCQKDDSRSAVVEGTARSDALLAVNRGVGERSGEESTIPTSHAPIIGPCHSVHYHEWHTISRHVLKHVCR